MKKLINDPADVVGEALARHRGSRTPNCGSTTSNKIIYRGRRAGHRQGRPHLRRRLRARTAARRLRRASACSTPPAPARCSPPRLPDQMLEATKLVDGGAGVLHIVKNYTGDVMNFEMAAELAAPKARRRVGRHRHQRRRGGAKTALYTAGRRGVGVTVLLEKIAGPPQRAGPTSADGRADRAQGERMRRAAWAWPSRRARFPAVGKPTFELGDDRDRDRDRDPRRARPLPLSRWAPAGTSPSVLLDPIVADLPYESG